MFCFCFLRTFAPIFTSNILVFVDRGRKNISFPRAQSTLATPLGNSPNCLTKLKVHLVLFPISGPSSLPAVVTQPDERLLPVVVGSAWRKTRKQNSFRADTEHTTSGSNKKEDWRQCASVSMSDNKRNKRHVQLHSSANWFYSSKFYLILFNLN